MTNLDGTVGACALCAEDWPCSSASRDPLVKALESTKGPHQEYAEELAIGIREALPPEAAFVTVDSLAAALGAVDGMRHFGPRVTITGPDLDDIATAIIRAAQEAEHPPCITTGQFDAGYCIECRAPKDLTKEG
jgi:hypothetical protein